MRGDVPEELLEIAAAQEGVIARRQALSAGMSRGSLVSKVRSGRWQPIYPGVYAVFTGSLPRLAQLWAVLLWAGEDAMLSHESAAEVLGMLSRPARVIHVSIPLAQRRLRRIAGVRVHRSKYLPDPALFPPGRLPVTAPADTVLDLINATTSADDMCGWITRGLAKGGVSAESLRAAMARRSRVRGRPDIEILITEAVEGMQSPLEHRYDRYVERAHGLPRSTRQAPYTKPGGTTGYRDRYYEAYGVIVELDGRADHPDDRRQFDTDRDNAAVVTDDARTLRYGWRRVRWSPCDTAIEVAGTLRNHGWTGHLRPCSPTCRARRTG